MFAPPVTLGALFGLVSAFVRTGMPADQKVMQLIGYVLFAGSQAIIIGAPILLLIGLPLHVRLDQKGQTTRRHYLIAGAIAGAASAVALLLITRQDIKLVMAALGLVCCIAGGAVFWMIRRPDLKERPS